MKKSDKRMIRLIAFYAFAVVAASLLFYFLIFKASSVGQGLAHAIDVFRPILYGLVISYVLYPVMQPLENRVIRFLVKIKHPPGEKAVSAIHVSCAVISIILGYLVIFAISAVLLPEIVKSVQNIVQNVPYYIRNIRLWLNNLIANNPWLSGSETVEQSTESLNETLSQISYWVTDQFSPRVDIIATRVTSSIFTILNFLYNFFIGTIVAIYVLISRDRLLARTRRFIYSVFSVPTANQILHNIRFVDEKLGGFLLGKILDSIIIGLICYVAMTILQFPYTLLISVVIGVTNIIPFFGPFIGAVPSAFLIFVNNPIQALYFIIFVLVLQQFDGNFVGPKILGNSVGVSSFMVLISILIGSGFLGVYGMIIAVPTAAVLTAVCQNMILKRLVQRKLPGDLESYRHMDKVDPWTRATVEEPFETEGKSFYMNLKRKSDEVLSLENPIPVAPWDMTIEDVEKAAVQRRAEMEVEKAFIESEKKKLSKEKHDHESVGTLRSLFGMDDSDDDAGDDKESPDRKGSGTDK